MPLNGQSQHYISLSSGLQGPVVSQLPPSVPSTKPWGGRPNLIPAHLIHVSRATRPTPAQPLVSLAHLQEHAGEAPNSPAPHHPQCLPSPQASRCSSAPQPGENPTLTAPSFLRGRKAMGAALPQNGNWWSHASQLGAGDTSDLEAGPFVL